MVKVIHSAAQPHLLKALRALFETKWPDFESAFVSKNFQSPLLLLDDADKLIGGLSFTRSLSPDKTSEAVWINAVTVRPNFQRRGFASQLVDQGCTVAKDYGAHRLSVYTDVPDLYIKLGWREVTRDEGGHVCTKVLG